jgi:hypothetical protein
MKVMLRLPFSFFRQRESFSLLSCNQPCNILGRSTYIGKVFTFFKTASGFSCLGPSHICAEQKILGHEQDEMVQNLVKTESFS